MTLHRVYYQTRHNSAGKRTIELEQAYGSEDSLLGLNPEALAREASPVEALALADHLEQVMQHLQPLQHRMLEMRLQGHNLDAIAAATDRTERTVRRVLEEIKGQLRE